MTGIPNLYASVVFDEAKELVQKMLTTLDADELANLMEHVVDSSDRAHAVLFFLISMLRADLETVIDTPAVALANSRAPGRLLLPGDM